MPSDVQIYCDYMAEVRGRIKMLPLVALLAAPCSKRLLLSVSVSVLLWCCPDLIKSAESTEAAKPSDDGGRVVPPEVVRAKNVQVSKDIKRITMSNADGDYHLFCNIKAAGCVTPVPGQNYLLFNDRTHWKMPGAENFIGLAVIQDWTVTYKEGENIGLIPQDNSHHGGLGIYILDSWSATPH